VARLTLVRRADDRRLTDDEAWWRDATFYQVYVRSFADADGDGVGDLEGVRSRLGYLELLGVDALWLTPFFRSPMVDHGYDVSDPRAVDPLFGDLNGSRRPSRQRRVAPSETVTSSATVPGSVGRDRRTTGRAPSAARHGPDCPLRSTMPGSGTCTCSRPSSQTSTGTTRR
jgi:hypothetical protein